jgi:hypothetical protein
MTRDSRAEILIVAGVAVLILLFWHRNRAAAGSGASLTLLPAAGSPVTNSGVPLALTMPDNSDNSFSYTSPGTSIDVGGAVYNFGSPNSCGCGGNLAGGPTYGSESDLAGALLAGGYDEPFVAPGGAY